MKVFVVLNGLEYRDVFASLNEAVLYIRREYDITDPVLPIAEGRLRKWTIKSGDITIVCKRIKENRF